MSSEKGEDIRLYILSLGAGVQSTTMALMAAHGEIGPMPHCAIFADTQWEPKGVYDHLTWLEGELPFPVYRVTAGSIRDNILRGQNATGQKFASVPWYTGEGGMGRRQCTKEYKIEPIIRKTRELLGLKPRKHAPRTAVVEQWIGISTDEAIRMKPSRLPYIRHRWPLIEKRMSRTDCMRWFEGRYPGRVLQKSSCIGCPFHSNDQWREIRDNPEAWADAVEIDRAIRMNGTTPRGVRSIQYMHRSLKPLDQVDLSTPEERGQLNLFLNECEGMCGV